MKSKDLHRIGRRDFLASAAGLAGTMVPGWAFAQAKPCPPSPVAVQGGTSALSSCGSSTAPGSLPALGLSGGGAGKPWTFGQAFRKGDVPAYLTATGAESFQADVRNRWSDGSVKFAVVSGIGGTNVQFAPAAAPSSGTTVAEPATLEVSVTFTGAVTGTYTLQSCLGVDRSAWSLGNAGRVRQFLGPVMSEFHYYRPTTDPHVVVWFYVRRYSNGATEVETCVENGWARVAAPGERAYGVTVSVGGATRYNASLVHYHHTRWSRRDWIGTDPQVVPVHDGAYLKATTLVPNYAPQGISEATLASLPQSGAVFSRGSFEVAADSGGAAPHIGLLPLWEVAYVQTGDVRAYRATLVNEQALGCCDGGHGSCTRDEATGLPIVLTSFHADSYSNGYGAGKVQLGTNSTNNAGSGAKYVWKNDEAHAPSSGYLPYLLTGRWFSLETCQLWAGQWYLSWGISGGANDGQRWGQDRMVAWKIRNLCTALAITPDTQATLRKGYSDHLNTFWNKWRNTEVGFNNLGVRKNIYNYTDYAPSPYLSCGAFQQYFVMQAFGYGYEIASELVSTTARSQWMESLQFHAKFTTGLLGTRPDGYCFRRSGTYGLAVGPDRATDRYAFFSTWAQVYAAEVAIGKIPAGELCSAGSTLLYGSTDPNNISGTSYFANMHPAAAYAKQFGTPGADAAWGRFTGSESYASLYSDFQNRPQFSVMPR